MCTGIDAVVKANPIIGPKSDFYVYTDVRHGFMSGRAELDKELPAQRFYEVCCRILSISFWAMG